MRIATQPNGHGATGRTDGTILLRARRLDAIDIDPVSRRARVGAGVPSGRLQAAAAPHSLTGLPGSSPVVSITGVALGGGLSWFGRKYGWIADAVTAIDIVDANGHPRRVTADRDADLFWAMRGAGGDFAVVTALELTLRSAPQLYGGRMLWPAQHAPAVMAAFRQITATAPDDLTVWFSLLHFPGADPTVAVDATYLGDEITARDLLGSLESLPQPLTDNRRTMAVSELGGITGEPTNPSPGASHAELLTDLSDDTVKTLLGEPIAPLLSVQIRHLGGALADPSDSPHGPLAEPYLLYMFGIPADAPRAQAIATRQRDVADALPVSGRKPFTYLNAAETVADAFTPEIVERLRAIKRHHDPNNLFRSNFPVEG